MKKSSKKPKPKPKPKPKQAAVPDSLVNYLLETFAGGAACFKPDKAFYGKVGCRQRRWGQLVRGEASPTIEELRKICAHFNIAFEPEAFFRQLTLFPELELKQPANPGNNEQ